MADEDGAVELVDDKFLEEEEALVLLKSNEAVLEIGSDVGLGCLCCKRCEAWC